LPAGTKVFYSAAATHLLPEIWREPARFDPDRFAPPREEHRKVPFALVGFGGGPRVCIGFAFARYELALLLAIVSLRFSLTSVPGQTIVQRYGVTSRPRHGIRVRVQPRRGPFASR
jgi:cytochrome P450